MLKIYTRHVASCPNKDSGYRKCRCPKWIMGALPSGEFVRESTKQTSWSHAERVAQARWDNSLPGAPTPIDRHKVSDAVSAYMRNGETRQLRPGTNRDRNTVLKVQLLPWCSKQGILYLEELSTQEIAAFMDALRIHEKNSGTTRRKKFASLCAFFSFCVGSDMLKSNPIVGKLKQPQSDSKPTDWLDDDEYAKVLESARNFKIRGIDCEHRSERALYLIELMRWSGLRREDAVTLQRSRIDANGHLYLHTAKTGIPVLIALPPHLVEGLRKLPCRRPEYFFWTGNGTPKAATSGWDRTLKKIFARSGVKKHIHCHMLRDTFAVSLLLKGVPIYQVSKLLGHSSVKTTEKHYAPFVSAMRDQLLMAVRQTWPVPPPDVQPVPAPRLES